ncbi:hypothetical protein VPHD480_0176 [Vibrio phage D480]
MQCRFSFFNVHRTSQKYFFVSRVCILASSIQSCQQIC